MVGSEQVWMVGSWLHPHGWMDVHPHGCKIPNHLLTDSAV
jgi:hypothetical protein